jgi:hypothetical protein
MLREKTELLARVDVTPQHPLGRGFYCRHLTPILKPGDCEKDYTRK